ncbi:flagellar protein FlgN [Salinisphaera sp. SPP-AMP-43]|uniref:flagella synthesis protein FlgN n=1 Tax=Salinisphaera sp. SPP-AMP-43 TaxID=3121288 RepID=UPI003C6EA2DB
MSQTAVTHYAEHLSRQNAAVEAFVEVLHRERDVLAARPVPMDQLSDVTETKSNQAAVLEDMERTRRALADAERADRGDLDDREIAERFGCRDLWAQLSMRVAEARTQNDINGLAIQTRLDYTNRALGFLRRSAAQSLYAADGQRRPSSQGRLRGGA